MTSSLLQVLYHKKLTNTLQDSCRLKNKRKAELVQTTSPYT